jgi:tetratricopeptide (TPR) repeat protein
MAEERKVGPFILEKRLGAGAMGVVYRARHVPTGRIVAVKLFPLELLNNEGMIQRFRREMKVLLQLKHPNIVRCYGGSPDPPQPYFAMEYIDGGSLADLIRRKGRLPWEEVIDYGIQICSALDCAHSHGIIHRDLKPSNLLLTETGVLKLSDFGLARGQDTTALTAPGKTVGTYCYMAPEQISGKPGLSTKTDLYALGCVLFEMLTGRPPFLAESAAEILYKHLQEPPPHPREIALDCPIWLDAIVVQLLQKEPSHRPLDAVAVAQALEDARQRALAQTAATLDPAGTGTTVVSQERQQLRELLRPKKKRRRPSKPVYERPWVYAAGLALLAAFVVYMMWPMSEDALYYRAAELMRSNDAYKHQEALDKYLRPYLERYPDGKYVEQVRQWIDEIEMDRAERRAILNARLGREPSSEAERLFMSAWRLEQFGDLFSALERYRSLVQLLSQDEKAQAYVKLARRKIAQLEKDAVEGDRVQFVQQMLERAEKLYQEGRLIEAQKIWDSIVTLYADQPDLKPYVDQAWASLKASRPAGRAPARTSPPNPESPTSAPAPKSPAAPAPEPRTTGQ